MKLWTLGKQVDSWSISCAIFEEGRGSAFFKNHHHQSPFLGRGGLFQAHGL